MNIAWDRCEVTFFIDNPAAAQDVGLCDELPPGWVVTHPVKRHDVRRWALVFEVQGDVLEADGLVVGRILQRLGAVR